MIAAKQTCPDDGGWALEYDGFLATQGVFHKGAEYVCVSSGMEATPDDGYINGGFLESVMSRITHEIFAYNHARTQFERGYAKIECVITLNTSPKQVPKT